MPTKTGLALGLVLGLALTGGCSLIKDPNAKDPSEAPLRSSDGSGPVSIAEPTALPTAFVRDESITFPEENVLDAVAGDDSVLTRTRSSITARSLPDLDTAYALTSANGDFTDLRVDAFHDEGYTLEVKSDPGEGTSVGQDRFTVQRFDLETGEVSEVAIGSLAQDPLNSATDATARIAGVEDDVVLVNSWVPDTDGAHTLVALDLADGSLAWKARPAQFLINTSDTVVLDTGLPDEAGRIEARELGNGLRRWSALPGTLGASAIGTTEDSVLVARDDDVFTEATITRLDLATGKAGRPRPTDSWDWTCSATSHPIAVCTLADGQRSESDRLVGWDLERNRPAWQLPADGRFAPIVTLVQDDLVWGLLDSGQGVVLDGISGRDVAGDTGAGPIAVNDYGGVILYSERAIFLPSGTVEEKDRDEPSGSPSP